MYIPMELKMKLMAKADDGIESAYLEYLMLLDTYGLLSSEKKLKQIREAEQFFHDNVLDGKALKDK